MQNHSSSPVLPLTVSRNPAPLAGTIRVPGDKSISHRALMLASLAEGRTVVTGLLEGEDVLRTADAMRALGARIAREGDRWVIDGSGVGALQEPEDVLDMGNSGTAARLLSGILSSHAITSFMTGDASLRSRPMRRVTQPLSGNGSCFATRKGEKLPMAIIGTGEAAPLTYCLPVASAQVKSAILLAGLNARGRTRVEEPVATRDHTENMLRHFGVPVEVGRTDTGGRVITLTGPAKLTARDVVVPADPSSAAFPIVAASLVPGSEIRLPGVGLNPLRTGLFQTLREMGAVLDIENARIEGGEPVGDIVVRSAALHGVDVPADRAPSMIDEYPVLAVACAFASGVSRLRGLDELRVKESDRLAATVALLRVNGAVVRVEGDDMIIEGRGGPSGLGGGLVETKMDHRLAMSAIVFGLAAESPVRVDDTGFINTSFPGFVGLMAGIGAEL
ncbi:3-phosphoshikimate 1-carboxyvinyltransferase [Swaminathania salitolerans]|uniref:3-phosphoshikimate 1-carboxyvinyltransferase n=1 Tax=Swaminathania salitolerans TaxID=182838 RepID=A0A511BLT4_9PROT|nr:3-phosphoshikimate 1-carboxyvinyltransferase [Swaminathania salitolerans]GBQ10450.1 3-phosphoshikimate 1-carboxyvinyltransferase [Swaminathania salitolerans LMG 21291]GEL01291.1 3-phosphoshikimate 1-carboxyvinyltransferase [Swaminathania salitolerans]